MKTFTQDYSLAENVILNKKYRVKKVISVSHLSIIYLVEKTENKEKLVIKEFFPKQFVLRDLDHKTLVIRSPSQKKQVAKLKEQFFNEINILKKFTHQHIVPFIDTFEENETVYLVMKYCEGLTLDRLIKEQKIRKEKLYRKIFPSIIKAVAYIHKKGIIHRDIKPSNILIDKNGTPYLIDFGSAIYYKTLQKNKIFTTVGYSPLELYSENNKLGKKVDIYSLAATMYFSLSGGIAPMDCSKRIIEDSIENIKKYNTDISAFFAFVIMWGLALKPFQRCFSLKFLEMGLFIERLLGKMHLF